MSFWNNISGKSRCEIVLMFCSNNGSHSLNIRSIVYVPPPRLSQQLFKKKSATFHRKQRGFNIFCKIIVLVLVIVKHNMHIKLFVNCVETYEVCKAVHPIWLVQSQLKILTFSTHTVIYSYILYQQKMYVNENHSPANLFNNFKKKNNTHEWPNLIQLQKCLIYTFLHTLESFRQWKNLENTSITAKLYEDVQDQNEIVNRLKNVTDNMYVYKK